MANRRKKREPVDRLSSLHDSILITILSFLPFETAVTTSVLSHRWRYLWTHLTHINLTTVQPRTRAFRILSKLTSPKFNTLTVTLDRHVSVVKPKSPFLLPWVTRLCHRNLELMNANFADCHIVDSIYLPYQLLTCQSLRDLTLHGPFEFKLREGIDHVKFINLPNLKKLDLLLTTLFRPVMSSLFKSCPLLEDLRLKLLLWKSDQFVDISAPKLKRLFIEISETSFTDHRFVINAPMLEFFDIHRYLVFFEFVKNPSTSLQQVSIVQDQGQGSDDKDYSSKIEGLFRGICYAESIILRNWDLPMLSLLSELDAIDLPVFYNLRSLTINRSKNDKAKLWNDQFPRLPNCLLGNLKWLEVTNLRGNELDINMLQYILCNAPCLQQLHVSVCHHKCDDVDKDPLRKEHEFCKRLFMLPESSLGCRIQFSGDVITASSEGFIDDVLTCQLKIDMHQP